MTQNIIGEPINQWHTVLHELHGGSMAEALLKKYTFSEDYLIDYSANCVVSDIAMMERLSSTNQYALDLHVNPNRENIWQVKLIKVDDQVSLSRGLPIIENFGFKLIDEHPYVVTLENGNVIHICDFGVQVEPALVNKLEDANAAQNLKDAIVAAFNRQIDNDGLNQLVLFSGLKARAVRLLRAVTHYLVQTSLPFSSQYMAECLARYPDITYKLYALFEARFNLSTHDVELAKKIQNEIIDGLEGVTSLDDDRILNACTAVINAMLRTNYYQKDKNGLDKEYISFKLESGQLKFLPKPLPLYEIFVYSRRFEAIHLRGGKVARGGFRWSDRREDFRTEVLGLVKAQIVKNSVIVPTGSKGGFFCKKLPPITEREAYMAEGVYCYKTFIAGLLDITDNLVSGAIVPPHDVIRYDNDDPYLVAAADKGTATFSDYANEMSKEYNFWLGDAFASGGSAGYDHKKMGITARGAWEAAKRHFRHLNIDIQTQDFSVIGIGDMAGDVFGNGMLLSKHIKLLAAFNHQHIFLDPHPDVAASFAERERLFNLPRSSWADYDSKKISSGGGVYARSLKAIPLSKEVQYWLRVDANELNPNELIRAILKSDTDMLYNGGIGTYIKAESESHEAVKDKANDQLRVNGNELRVKVVVEGGNLGVTQLGRIEFAKNGGAIYNDAIDNSAGVDCSDHEVNIKILFTDVMHSTKMSLDKRNEILASMTDDIAALVLRDNYLQTEVLRYASTRAEELFSININFMDKLEKRGELDRYVEFLPNAQEIAERTRLGIGLTTPELSVLLAYSKIILDREILHSDLTEDPAFNSLLVKYFPTYLQQNYLEYINRHYLRKEIIATQLSNLMVNRMGITFVSRFEDEFRTDVTQIARAFWAVYNIVGAEGLFAQIEALDNKVQADVQVELLIYLKKALERSIRWLLRRVKDTNELSGLVDTYGADMKRLIGMTTAVISPVDYPQIAQTEDHFVASGVPLALAQFLSRSSAMAQLLDVVILARETRCELETVARNYFYAGRMIRMDWLRKNLIALPENNKWQALSRSALLADAYVLYSAFIKNAITVAGVKDAQFAATWLTNNPEKVAQLNSMFDELQNYKTVDLAMLSAAVRELGTILG